jgi:hypothetical protein
MKGMVLPQEKSFAIFRNPWAFYLADASSDHLILRNGFSGQVDQTGSGDGDPMLSSLTWPGRYSALPAVGAVTVNGQFPVSSYIHANLQGKIWPTHNL